MPLKKTLHELLDQGRLEQIADMAVWCLTQLGQAKLLTGRPELLRDQRPVDLYEDGNLNRTSVSHLVRTACGPRA